MRDHQKYFGVENREGRLAPHFLAVINLERDPKGLIGAEHERVLGARFADARFFWETDQKCRLADYLPKLEIGRASCRERVEGGGVGVACREKRRESWYEE